MRPITFCIATANNERDYVTLLLRSLIDNTEYKTHEFLIFVDSDNQNTFDVLTKFKQTIPNLKIYKNDSKYPVGSQRNVSIMFNAASNDVVCYLQSDMVVSGNFDKYLNESLVSENQILCFTRIEPPLHPGSPEKIVMNFGIHPEEFKYQEFLKFAENIQNENRPNTNGHFAPFAVFKRTWIDVLGGFDTQFRCSREDSDVILRLHINNIETIQTWRGMVYHFTCVSSRGHEWFKQEKSKDSELTLQMQQLADMEELKRYIRKWGFFGHEPRPVYDITFFLNVDGIVNFDLLKFLEVYCTRFIITDESVANHLRERVEFDTNYYSNFRWKYSKSHWDSVKHLFNPTDWNQRIQYAPEININRGTVVNFTYSVLNNLDDRNTRSMFENIHALVEQNNIGKYEFNGVTINIFDKIDTTDFLKKNNNLQLVLNHDKFIFV